MRASSSHKGLYITSNNDNSGSKNRQHN